MTKVWPSSFHVSFWPSPVIAFTIGPASFSGGQQIDVFQRCSFGGGSVRFSPLAMQRYLSWTYWLQSAGAMKACCCDAFMMEKRLPQPPLLLQEYCSTCLYSSACSRFGPWGKVDITHTQSTLPSCITMLSQVEKTGGNGTGPSRNTL